ncbi:hypothetical protein TTHERM_001344741 (macronuclear) [Tetrahymena thermophila SB210]|uniref:Uncharacterized protein n=1 Tax=Tetrahymena thermophila (strain SB210) TaxID=312017 RepID=W7X041_TETTS|nr:hypothetical protein TTHERM_001344741 [Tetrahymena thermophila SB210]EWS71232.1 hypothetical protein TTHERM_001344741 [Tetrahymena thermophila SB210]|eukprot:XP_012656233.1 hypothetical protein TTHERM_001344741 [Tetrahymena thermophila SB210]
MLLRYKLNRYFTLVNQEKKMKKKYEIIRLINQQLIKLTKNEKIRNHNKKNKENKSNKLKELQCFKLTFIIKNITRQNKQIAFIKYKFQQQKIKKKYQIIKNEQQIIKQKLKLKLSQNSKKNIVLIKINKQ